MDTTEETENIDCTFKLLKNRSSIRRLTLKKYNYQFPIIQVQKKYRRDDNRDDFNLGLEGNLVPLNPKDGPKNLFGRKKLGEE